MRIGLVMDASCDLPQACVDAHQIMVLPVHVKLGDEAFIDRRDQVEIERFLDRQQKTRHHDTAHTEPCSVETMQALFLDRLVTQFDCVFCLTSAAELDPTHANATRAGFGVLKHYQAVREQAGQHGQFLLRVIDTRTLAAGAAVVVAEATRTIKHEQVAANIREHLMKVSANACSYLLPRHVRHLRSRASGTGKRRIGLMGTALDSALDIKPILRCRGGQIEQVGKARGFEEGAEVFLSHIAERIGSGLEVPFVVLTYGGPLADMHALPGYEAVREACREADVELLESMMSISGMARSGTGALAAGLACEHYTPDF
ncbi:MAG TPA: DegV family protein [Oleiagrimonas sp.]|nr:DegV family protein [Oleiagrimonas sp.]